jgi:tRNA-Thr(GGU) m(6)t(6)A37 methyltransferase TsaA
MKEIEPIGFVKNDRTNVEDDYWGGLISEIVVDEKYGADSLTGIEDFSHAEIVFYFNKVEDEKIITIMRHPRNNPDWPKIGIFAQRGKNRPNKIGITIVKILKRERNILSVQNLDAIDGTPVLDIKPVMIEFLPKEKIHQPEWATELMKNYW